MNLLQDICVQHSIESAEEETKKKCIIAIVRTLCAKTSSIYGMHKICSVCSVYNKCADYSNSCIQNKENVFLIKGLCID